MVTETAVGRAVEIIWEKISTLANKPSFNDYGVRRVQKAAAHYNADQPATGMVVEYADGSTDVFYGETTDPYRGTDWAFVNVETGHVFKGYKFSPNDTDYEWASAGIQPVNVFQDEMERYLVGSYPMFAEGPDEFAGDKVVVSATVL